MDALSELQEWYVSHCNGDWEHHYGVSIDTLDNPGWQVSIDLTGTGLEGKSFQDIVDLESESEWIHCKLEEKKFQAYCSPRKLEEVIQVFLRWAKSEKAVEE